MEIKNEITLEESLRLASLKSYNLDYFEANDDSDSGSKACGLDNDSKKISKKRTKYQRIDDSLRQKLIDAVVKDGQMLKAAAKKFKINYSSAKSIFHTFRKEGRVNKKAVRERYVKTSFVSPSSTNALKQSRKSSISDLKASLKTTESSSVFLPKPADLKAAQLKPYLMDPHPTVQASNILSHVDKMSSQSSEYQLNNPHSLQSYRLMQNLLQQSANLRLLQEFTKLQSMVPATLPMLAGKQQLGAGQSPFVNIPPPSMMGLQTAPIGYGGLNLQFNGLQGYSALGGLYSVGTGK